MITNLNSLYKFIEDGNYDFLVLEGYNSVGKSRILEGLIDHFNIGVYRPDYLGWTSLLSKNYRWSIFCSFFDIAKKNDIKDCMKYAKKPLLIFDRGCFSGSVYNEVDVSPYYSSIIGDFRVLHILVTCDAESYEKFLSVRASNKVLKYKDCIVNTQKYIHAFEEAGAEFVLYINSYDEDYARSSMRTCLGCSHYNLGTRECLHPTYHKKDVSPDTQRCQHSSDMEVQDGNLIHS